MKLKGRDWANKAPEVFSGRQKWPKRGNGWGSIGLGIKEDREKKKGIKERG
jgi:hypothetical protein